MRNVICLIFFSFIYSAYFVDEQKRSELLVPLIMMLTVFIALMAIAMIGLILSYFIADVTSHNGIIIRLTYDTVVIPFASSLGICFGCKKKKNCRIIRFHPIFDLISHELFFRLISGGAIAFGVLFLTYSLYKSINKEEMQRISTIERKHIIDSRPSSKTTMLTTDM